MKKHQLKLIILSPEEILPSPQKNDNKNKYLCGNKKCIILNSFLAFFIY